MAQKNRVSIELYVDDKGTVHVKSFSQAASREIGKVADASEKATSRIRTGWDKIKSSWLEVIGSLYAVKKAWDLINMAAKARQERQAFESLAASYGTNAKDIITELKRVSGETIDTMTLIRNAGTAMMMGIAPDKIVKLMEIAKATSKMTGQTITKAFEDISLAVGRQSKMILDNLGIMVQQEKANEAYATSLGKTASQLTDAERKMAFMNETIKAGEDLMRRLGDQTETTSDRIERFNATLKNTRMQGADLLIRSLFFLQGTFQGVSAAVLYTSGSIFKLLQSFGALSDLLPGISGQAKYWGEQADAAFGSSWELVEKANQAFKDMKGSTADIISLQKSYQPGAPGPRPSPALDEDYYKEQMEEWKQVTADFYAMKGAQEKADLAQHKATLEEWGQVTKDFYEAEQAQWEQETEAYLALEEIKAQAHQEEMARYEEVMAANEAYMKQYEANEKAKAALAYQTTLSMVSWYAAAFKELAKGSNLAFGAAKMFSAMETLMKTHEFAVKAAAWAATWGGLPAAMAAKAIAWGVGIAHVRAIQKMEPAAYYHEGGIVGRGSRPTRLVSPDVFAGAQRAHQGLGPDERPVIVKKDEGIFTPAQMAALSMGEKEIHIHNHLYINGRPVTKEVIHTLETDGILNARFKKV